MVTREELDRLEQQQREIVNRPIPQRRFGSSVSRQDQNKALDERETARKNISNIRNTRDDLNAQEEQESRSKDRIRTIQTAIRRGTVAGSNLNREDRQLVTNAITARELAFKQRQEQRASKPEIVGSGARGGVLVLNPETGQVTEQFSSPSSQGPTLRESLRQQSLPESQRTQTPKVYDIAPSLRPDKRVETQPAREVNLPQETGTAAVLREKKFTSESQVTRFGATFALEAIETGRGVKKVFTQSPKTTAKEVTQSSKDAFTKAFITGEGFPEVGRLAREQPEVFTAKVTFQYALLKLPDFALKGTDLVRTFRLTEVETESVVAKEFFTGQKYPAIRKGQSAGELLEEFKIPALPSEATKEFKAAGFTSAPKPIKGSEVAAGSSELPGLYQAPRLSPAFLRVSSESEAIGFNVLGTLRPTAMRITPSEFTLPPQVKASTRSIKSGDIKGIRDFISTKAPRGSSVVPFIKTEKEAVIPVGTQLLLKKKEYFFRFEGRKIPIFEFDTIGGKVSKQDLPTIERISSRYQPKLKSRINPYTVSSSSSVLSSSRLYSSSKSLSLSSYQLSSKGSSSLSPVISQSKSVRSYSSSMYSSNSGRSSPSTISSLVRGTSSAYGRFGSKGSALGRSILSKFKTGFKEGSSRAYRTFVVKGGKKQLLPGIRTKGRALFYGESEAKRTLRATFGVEQVGFINQKDSLYTPSKAFRNFKIKGKTRIGLNDIYIQKTVKEGGLRGGRLASGGERRAIQAARMRI